MAARLPSASLSTEFVWRDVRPKRALMAALRPALVTFTPQRAARSHRCSAPPGRGQQREAGGVRSGFCGHAGCSPCVYPPARACTAATARKFLRLREP